MKDTPFTLAGRTYASRLLVGTGKYRDLEETRVAIEASGAEIVTVAVRRTNIGQTPGEPNLLDVISPERYTILPNTAGCYDAVEAVRTCRLARELLTTWSSWKSWPTRRPCSPMSSRPSRPPKPWSPMASTSWSTPATTPSSLASWKPSAASPSCRWPV